MSSDPNLIANQTQPETVRSERRVILCELFEALDKRGFVPLIALPSILGLTSFGASVGFSLIAGALISWVGFQLLLGRTYPFLPRSIAYLRLTGRLSRYVTYLLLESSEWLDEVPNARMSWLMNSAVAKLSYVAMICVGIALPVLALLGQPVFLIHIALLIYCVSLMTRDGRYVVAAASVLSFASIGPVLQLTS